MAEQKLRKLKVVSNGRPNGTFVYDVKSGEEIHGVFGVTWQANVNEMPYVTFSVYPDSCELEITEYKVEETEEKVLKPKDIEEESNKDMAG